MIDTPPRGGFKCGNVSNYEEILVSQLDASTSLTVRKSAPHRLVVFMKGQVLGCQGIGALAIAGGQRWAATG